MCLSSTFRLGSITKPVRLFVCYQNVQFHTAIGQKAEPVVQCLVIHEYE